MSSHRETASLRESQPINSNRTQSQPKQAESLYKSRTELDGLKMFYESLPCICFALNSTGVVLAVSQFGIAYLGYDALELVHQPVSQIFYWDDKINCQIKLTEVQQQPTQITQWEAQIIRKNGDIKWIRASARMVNETESDPLINLVFEDITVQKETEETLQKREMQFQFTFEQAKEKLEQALQERRWQEALLRSMTGASPLAFYVVENSTDTILYFNHRFCEIWGIESLEERMRRGELKNNDIIPHCLPLITQVTVLPELFKPLQDEQNRTVIEEEIPCIDGRTIRYFFTPIRDECDRYLGHLYICEDITERKRIEHALNLANFSFECFAMPAIWLNKAGNILGVNETACQSLGYSRDALHSMYLYEIAPDFSTDIWVEHWPIIKQQKTLTLLSRYRCKDGKITPIEITFNYLEFEGEEYNFAFSRDMTERLQAEAELFHQSLALANFSLNLKQLHRLNTAKYNNFEELFSEYLKTGCEILKLPIGIVSEIKGQCYSIRSVQSDFDVLVPGLEFELKDTYCAAVIEHRKTITYNHLGAIESRGAYPGYQSLKLEAYIGTPIIVNQQIYGTLNFSSTQAKPSDFEADEREIIELMAQTIGSFITAHQAEMERHQAEAALQESASRLKLALEAAQMGTWDWNIRTNEVVYSDELGPVFGLPRGTYHPNYEAFLNSVYPEDREYVKEALTRAVEEGADYGIEFRIILPDETVHWVGTKGQVYCDETGKPIRMIGVAKDITPRKQAEERLRQKLLREQLVGAIAQRIRQSLKLENILTETVAQIRQVLQTDRVVIFRFEPDWSGTVVVESVDERWCSILQTHLHDPCFKESYILPYPQGQVKAIEDIYSANLTPCHINLLETFQVRAKLVVPIFKGEQLWGMLIAHHCSAPRQWQDFEIEMLSSLSSQVEIAIQQSQLYEKAKSLLLREQALNQVSQAIRSSLNLNTIFSTAVCEIGKLLDIDHVQIVHYLPEQKLWLNVSEYRKSPDLPPTLGLKIPDENNPIAQQIKKLEIVKIHDAESCEDPINKDFAQTFPGAWLLVPLHINSLVWGSLSLVKNTRPYHWSDFEVEFICSIANQIAIAIQQAELYEQSRIATAKALTQAHQLEQTLQTLQKAQAQLVQSEKMSSLGQLVAGVAHEINNPVNFIYGNLAHASEYAQDLLSLLQIYQHHYPNPQPEIQSKIEAIELDFLITDLPKLLASMKIGAERICAIVSSLRNFSRLAQSDLKAVDIHEGIDSTLTLLQNRLKAQGKNPGIQVIKEYGNLPAIECYAGQLNQVFMNLLVNAIDAIEESSTSNNSSLVNKNRQIRIRTEILNSNQVMIRIADNGAGMTDDVKAKLFDPFFTTKPVGAGTGLGLSISYQIVVEKHSGQLYCQSELGQGTEFVIQIPLRQTNQKMDSQVEEFRDSKVNNVRMNKEQMFGCS